MVKLALATAVAASGVAAATATTFMHETFDAFPGAWVQSELKDAAEYGEWKHTGGKFEENKGIQTGEDARFYGLSAKMDKPIDNADSDLVLQFTAKHGQGLDCGGGYLKLLPAGVDAAKFGGDSPYGIMFGPDICGTGTRKTHVIFGHDSTHTAGAERKNLLTKKSISCETDKLTHLYTLIVKPDNTYEVRIDNKKKESGNLADDFDFLLPKEIKDPEQSKPADWVDLEKIPDPEDVKPEGWDDIPEKIPDPKAEKPEDWDDEDDGEWEAPVIANPEYKGEFKPKMIDNPDYKGSWVHPVIPNPDFVDDPKMYHVCNPCDAVGFELWQVKSGSVFDNILVTDSIEDAEKDAEAVLERMAAEKEKFDAAEEEEKKKKDEEREKADAKRKEADEKKEADEDDEEEEEEEKDEL